MLLVVRHNKLLYQLKINVIHNEINSRISVGILATIQFSIFFHPVYYLIHTQCMCVRAGMCMCMRACVECEYGIVATVTLGFQVLMLLSPANLLLKVPKFHGFFYIILVFSCSSAYLLPLLAPNPLFSIFCKCRCHISNLYH